ncbi:MAG: hypothetical protein Q9210_007001 [Variospora velana]
MSTSSTPNPPRVGWMEETEKGIDEMTDSAIRTSYKKETRRHRIRLYAERVAASRAQLAFYEAMLQMEKSKDDEDRRQEDSQGQDDGDWTADVQTQLQYLQNEVARLRLRDQAKKMDGGSGSPDEVKADPDAVDFDVFNDPMMPTSQASEAEGPEETKPEKHLGWGASRRRVVRRQV